MRPNFPASLLPVGCFVLGSAAALPAASLLVLPSPGPDLFSYGLALTANGAAVGHAADHESVSPLLWTKSSPGYSSPALLPLPLDATGGEARWISSDASLIAGYAALPLAGRDELNFAPLLWSRGASGTYTVISLPRLGATPAEGMVHAAAANGTRLVGHDGLPEKAAVWRGSPAASYGVLALTLPVTASGPSYATAVSGDGVRIVGSYTTSTGVQAVLWSEAGGVYAPRNLPALSGGTESFAECISADGALAGGLSDSAQGKRPVTWDTATGQARALAAPEGHEATVLTIAENKVWLGGRATDRNSFESRAVLWDQAGQVHDLRALAGADGAAFVGFTPESVTEIRFVANGFYTIIGTGLSLDNGLSQGFVLENLALTTPVPIPDPTPEPDPTPDPQPDPTPEPEPPGGSIGRPTPGGVFLNRRRRPASEATSSYLEREETVAEERPLPGLPTRRR